MQERQAWREIECLLFCITKLSKESKSQDVVNLSDVINLVEILPEAHKSLRL